MPGGGPEGLAEPSGLRRGGPGGLASSGPRGTEAGGLAKPDRKRVWRKRRGRTAAAAVSCLLVCCLIALRSPEAGADPVSGTSAGLELPTLDQMIYGEPGAEEGVSSVSVFPSVQKLTDFLTPLPGRFSWEDYGKKPTVRKQGDLGTCWALAAVEALEAAGLPDERMLYSADHLSLQNGFSISQDQGGDYRMILSYLADFKGPVPEQEDPYGDGKSPKGGKAALRVEEMQLLEGMSRSRIQHMIYRYGPVQSSLCMDRDHTDGDRRSCYRSETASYFDPLVEALNHDVLVLGWDDSYPKENFRIHAREDGAWICLNSWGEAFGDQGIFYVSYDDANLFRRGGVAYTVQKPARDEDLVLETDRLGWQARQGYRQESAYFAGVFRPEEGSRSGGDLAGEPASEEKGAAAAGLLLDAVGLYAVGPGTSYRIYLLEDFQGPEDLTEPARLLATGWLPHPGFYTIRPDRKIALKEGQAFALLVWIDTPGEDKPVAVEVRKDAYTATVSLEGRESYISRDKGRWDRTQTKYGTNVCLKAYLKKETAWDSGSLWQPATRIR